MTLVSSSKSIKLSLERLLGVLNPFLASNLRAMFRLLPTVTKYLLLGLLLANLRSWPFAWHIRVFRPVIQIRLRYKLFQWRTMLKSRTEKILAEDKWLESITPIGADPLNYTIKYNTWASIDDSDYNGHLSNSSYGKTFDAARLKSAIASFPMFFRAGGWIALAATHYSFIREIPMLASYEVRMSIKSWDQKWLYVVGKFVTKPSKKSKKPEHTPQQQPTPPSNGDNTGALFNPSLHIPADEISSSSTPFPAKPTSDSDTTKALKAVTASLASEPEPDGATLHTIAVAQVCFKVGRITVPPAVVLAMNGFCAPAAPAIDGSVTSGYSSTNPPPHWTQVRAVISKPAGGSTRAATALCKGGWRDIPETERWWDAALVGLEERRMKGLDVLKSLTTGIGGVRKL